MKETRSDEIPQLEAMRMGVAYCHPIKIREFSVQVRPLTHMEMVLAAQETADVLLSYPETARNPITEHSVLCKKMLIKASTSDVGVEDPKISAFILDRMTNEELEYLFKQYVAVTDRCNPSLDALSIDEVNVLIDEVKKNPRLATELSFRELANIVLFLVTKDG